MIWWMFFHEWSPILDVSAGSTVFKGSMESATAKVEG